MLAQLPQPPGEPPRQILSERVQQFVELFNARQTLLIVACDSTHLEAFKAQQQRLEDNTEDNVISSLAVDIRSKLAKTPGNSAALTNLGYGVYDGSGLQPRLYGKHPDKVAAFRHSLAGKGIYTFEAPAATQGRQGKVWFDLWWVAGSEAAASAAQQQQQQQFAADSGNRMLHYNSLVAQVEAELASGPCSLTALTKVREQSQRSSTTQLLYTLADCGMLSHTVALFRVPDRPGAPAGLMLAASLQEANAWLTARGLPSITYGVAPLCGGRAATAAEREAAAAALQLAAAVPRMTRSRAAGAAAAGAAAAGVAAAGVAAAGVAAAGVAVAEEAAAGVAVAEEAAAVDGEPQPKKQRILRTDFIGMARRLIQHLQTLPDPKALPVVDALQVAGFPDPANMHNATRNAAYNGLTKAKLQEDEGRLFAKAGSKRCPPILGLSDAACEAAAVEAAKTRTLRIMY